MPRSEGVNLWKSRTTRAVAEFDVYMSQMAEFAGDLRRVAEQADVLDEWLRTGNRP